MWIGSLVTSQKISRRLVEAGLDYKPCLYYEKSPGQGNKYASIVDRAEMTRSLWQQEHGDGYRQVYIPAFTSEEILDALPDHYSFVRINGFYWCQKMNHIQGTDPFPSREKQIKSESLAEAAGLLYLCLHEKGLL